jgi:hypothetical protein
MALIKINNRSSEDTVKYGRRNFALNPAMSIQQKPSSLLTGFSASAVTMLDTMMSIIAGTTTGLTWDITRETDAPTGTGLRHSMKYTVATDDSSASNYYSGWTQRLEANHIAHLFDEDNITVSFWIKSNVTGTYTFVYQYRQTDSGEGDDRTSYVAPYTVSASGTWEKISITIPKHPTYTLKDDATMRNEGMSMTWMFHVTDGYENRTGKDSGWLDPTNANNSNADADYRNAITSADHTVTNFNGTVGNYMQITGIQLEAGEIATQFEHRPREEYLRECQRYLYVINQQGAGSTDSQLATGLIPNSNEARVQIVTPVPMRTSPSKSSSSASDFMVDVESTLITGLTNIDYLGSEADNQIHGFEFEKTGGFGSYLGDAFILEWAGTANGGSSDGWFQLNAEL